MLKDDTPSTRHLWSQSCSCACINEDGAYRRTYGMPPGRGQVADWVERWFWILMFVCPSWQLEWTCVFWGEGLPLCFSVAIIHGGGWCGLGGGGGAGGGRGGGHRDHVRGGGGPRHPPPQHQGRQIHQRTQPRTLNSTHTLRLSDSQSIACRSFEIKAKYCWAEDR